MVKRTTLRDGYNEEDKRWVGGGGGGVIISAPPKTGRSINQSSVRSAGTVTVEINDGVGTLPALPCD